MAHHTAEIPGLVRGLEGVIAAPTAICDLDGVNGRLAYGGYDIEDLAAHSTFEEVVYLLWHGELPTREQLAQLEQALAAARSIPEPLVATLRLYPVPAVSMAAVRAAVGQLRLYDPAAEDVSPEALRRIALRLTAQMATIVATYQRIQTHQSVVAPRPDLGHAANFLYVLTGQEPDPRDARALDVTLILYAEHELNASTFAARVVASTLSDMYSAVTAGGAAVKGAPPPGGGGAGEGHARGNCEAPQPRALRAGGARPEAALHGVRPPGLQGRRPARPHPARHGRGGLRPERRSEVVPDVAQAPRDRPPREAPPPQRRLLLGGAPARARAPARIE